MANYEQKDNTFSLFKNDKKTEDRHPDYRGTMTVDGKKKEISVWVKTSANGVQYMSGQVKEPYVNPNAGQNAAPSVTYHSPAISSNYESDENQLPF